MRPEPVAVLDLGATNVRALYATQDSEGEMHVLGGSSVPSRGIARGVVTDLDEASRSIDAAVRRLQQEVGADINSLVVGISGVHVEGSSSPGLKPIVPKARHITHQDVMEVINHSRAVVFPPDREQFQALPREFRVDGQRGVQRPIGMSGATLEVTTFIASGQRTHIQNIERALDMAGRRIEQMVLSPLASGVGVLTPEEIELGTAVLDIGGSKTDLAIFLNGSIAYTACMPVGGMLVTSDLSKLLKTTPDEAERLKLEDGASYAQAVAETDSVHVMQLGQTMYRPMQRRVLCEIIESRMRELAVMVRQQIEKSGLIATLPGGMVLTGGGSRLIATDKLFSDVLRHLRVRVAEPLVPGIPGPGLAASVGMARYALQCYDELAPATGATNWKDRVRSLWSLIGARR